MPMNEVSASINIQSHVDWRRATAAQIADGLQSLRCKILQVFDAYVAADRLTVPKHQVLYQQGQNEKRSRGQMEPYVADNP